MPKAKTRAKDKAVKAVKRVCHHWLTFPHLKHQAMNMWVILMWQPDGKTGSEIDWFATTESWAVYDFLKWCVEHRDIISELRRKAQGPK